MTGPILLTVTRDFAAPPERVFDAWLDPAGAADFLFATPGGVMQQVEIDPRVGGRALIVERRPSGDARHRLQFEAIDRPRRLVFLFAADPAPEGEWTRVTIDIAQRPGGCTLVLTHEMDPKWAAYEEPTRNGWTTILASLARAVDGSAMIAVESPAPDTIRFERMLDAPVATVWRYLIDPQLRGEWFAAGETEPREGGTIEFVFDHDNLSSDDVPYPPQYAAHKGVSACERITRFDPPHALAFTFEKDGIATFELFPAGDRTRLVLTHSGIANPANRANFGGGWHSHLAVLQAKLAGGSVRDFWALHAQSEAAVAAALSATAG